jgi:flagellar protein FliO/FliZ
MDYDLGAMVRIVAGLATVLGLLFVCMYVVRRWQQGVQGHGRQDIQVITTRMILPKRYISLVRVYNKTLILGITDTSMTLLGTLETDGFQEVLLNAQEKGRDDEPRTTKLVH